MSKAVRIEIFNKLKLIQQTVQDRRSSTDIMQRLWEEGVDDDDDARPSSTIEEAMTKLKNNDLKQLKTKIIKYLKSDSIERFTA